MIRIPFEMWHSWTPQQRAEVLTYWENKGKSWYIDLTDCDPKALQKDTDEYREEMSIGGRPFKEI